MRFAIISDIHGNLDSLITFFKDIEKENVDGIFCLGDIVHRGFNFKENLVIDYLRSKRNLYCIQGNHDRELYQSEKISDENLSYLQSLPTHLILGDIIAFHSSLKDTDKYLFEKEDIMEEFKSIQENFGKFKYHLFGHIHQRAVYSYVPENNKVFELKINPIMPMKMEQYFISPGALGICAMDGMSYAILNEKQNKLKFQMIKHK